MGRDGKVTDGPKYLRCTFLRRLVAVAVGGLIEGYIQGRVYPGERSFWTWTIPGAGHSG